MGVLACNRNGCGNIMCDHHSDYYGYICRECLDELRSKVPHISVDGFMQSPKRGGGNSERMMREAAIAFIEEEFQTR